MSGDLREGCELSREERIGLEIRDLRKDLDGLVALVMMAKRRLEALEILAGGAEDTGDPGDSATRAREDGAPETRYTRHLGGPEIATQPGTGEKIKTGIARHWLIAGVPHCHPDVAGPTTTDRARVSCKTCLERPVRTTVHRGGQGPVDLSKVQVGKGITVINAARGLIEVDPAAIPSSAREVSYRLLRDEVADTWSLTLGFR